MRVAVIFATLAAIQLADCQSDFDGHGEYNLPTATRIRHSQDSNPNDSRLLRLERRFGEWILKRDTTTTADAVASTTATESVTSVTTTSSFDTTTTSTTSTTSSTISTTSSSFTTTTAATTTASTSATTSSTSSSTVTSSSSASTAASTTTSTATTTTSTTTPTTTESAELKEWNHRGTIAAIVTFSILGSFFVGACMARCIHNRAKKRRIEARKQLDKESLVSMLPLARENGKSASQLKLDRESIMFCDERRYYQGQPRPESVPSLSGQSNWQGSVAHSSMPSEDMGRSMSSGRQTPLGVRGEQHGSLEV
ncbi:uncharacterized protein CDV56_105602 [Aspergillus thermomutatus]|uniref:Mid2 domain-containing protein n=1 Tax=Aspergillus thermomutatus TaxID=41047 RepID=A0A397GJJ4_ASPTH|nr:uncharacterized protein CDV56_105602 [Aspergillus thermomutatus]RHZ49223.1 hypothetical protein CDV56_105602 [Aspergillus thermomutatus]